MIAVVPVRHGALPAGGDEAVAECGGRVCLFGSGTAVAAKALDGLAIEIRLRETVGFAPGAWACELASVVAGDSPVVLPASPDGRDLAPRVAALLDWPLLAGAMQVSTEGAALVRWGGLVIEEVRARGPFVATLQPGVRGVDRVVGPPPTLIDLRPMLRRIAGESPAHAHENRPPRDVEVLETLPPDVSTMDLAEAPRIVAGGAGLDGPDLGLEAAATDRADAAPVRVDEHARSGFLWRRALGRHHGDERGWLSCGLGRKRRLEHLTHGQAPWQSRRMRRARSSDEQMLFVLAATAARW